MSAGEANVYAGLDARLKLFQLFLVSLCAFVTKTLTAQILLLEVVLVLGLVAGQRQTVARFLWMAVPLVLYVVFGGGGTGTSMWVFFLRFLAFAVLKFSSPALLVLYLVRLEDLSAVIQALERLRFPRQVTLPLAVAIRFVPSLQYEYASIRDAMRLRGVAPTLRRFYAYPAQTLELTVIPLLMRAVRISEELSISALTRGMEREGDKSWYQPLVWTRTDTVGFIATALVGVLLFAVDLVAM
ncbi:transmembrane component of energizing module of ECF transporter [Myxococcus stipitatus DSM 14675]|uniref:Transmembrane component of energizing module of ECF transporter n=1 Tax=Myxococcus stipitatus (strain DSM 14675 / JCM 12634 / Mx s8) TaxID=1278073 RepID=L7UGA3_MYXSD|nr:energy-coupling factor transporter transmembrane component T [Myxococcus stipitatus]AGC46612.1 transmembrane component of energizing module of ECF transporter [Myxococcus stipitatus DSM 14675]